MAPTLPPPRAYPRAVARGEPHAIRVVLAEDDFLAREGITSALEVLDGVELAASCRDLEMLQTAIDRMDPDVVMSDVSLPPDYADEGVRLAAELRATHPHVGVVLLSQRAELQHALALFESGSHRRAYLLKERLKNAGELARAIREVAAGGALVDPSVVDELLMERRRSAGSPLASLTSRERQTLALITAGYANRAIAEHLGISKRGVERHINAIFAKLELGDSEDVSRRVRAALLFLTWERRRVDDDRPR